MPPSIAELHECLRLDAATGRLYWKARPRSHFTSDQTWAAINTRFAGREAFTAIQTDGYKHSTITIRGERHGLLAHRVVFAMHRGSWPKRTVDHKNGDVTDNKPSNLRNATKRQQCLNKRTKRTRSSGSLKGAYQSPSGRFYAQIRANGVFHHLGSFDTEQQANAAYAAAATKLNGRFARS